MVNFHIYGDYLKFYKRFFQTAVGQIGILWILDIAGLDWLNIDF